MTAKKKTILATLQIKSGRRVRHYEVLGLEHRVAFYLKETAGSQEYLREALETKNEILEAAAERSLASVAEAADVWFQRVPVRRKGKQPT